MHVLVTGTGGFVGSNVSQGLLRDGFRVSGVYRSNPTPSWMTSRDDGVEFIQADLADNLEALPDNVDAVIHAAARLDGVGVTIEHLVRDNIKATQNMISYARAAGARAFVYLSSTSVYGNISTDVLEHSSPIVSPGVYGLTKYLGEKIIEEMSADVPSLVFRLPGVIGRGAHRNFVATMLERIQSGQTVEIFNPQTRFNNVVHVSDLVELLSKVLRHGWSGFDVMPLGAGSELPIGEIPEVLMQAIGKEVPIEAVLEAQKPAYVIDNDYAQTRYGYSPVSLTSMLKDFAIENS
ncbi:MAG: NAD(P)-dependent oxidoreductase [Rhodospirillales bacterium]|nr:NAD(P)-dependent oxidoreductase [Rhodospirillales bacterium]